MEGGKMCSMVYEHLQKETFVSFFFVEGFYIGSESCHNGVTQELFINYNNNNNHHRIPCLSGKNNNAVTGEIEKYVHVK